MMVLFSCRMVMYDACSVCYVKLCDVRWVLRLYSTIVLSYLSSNLPDFSIFSLT